MKGFIVLNGYSDLPSAENQAVRLKNEFAQLGAECDILRNDAVRACICGGKIQTNLTGYDFCIYLDKDKYLSEMLESAGVRLFNRHSAIRLCDDKMRTHVALAKYGVPMPKTVAGLLCYEPDKPLNKNFLRQAAEVVGYPVIVKQCYGSLGAQVYKADDEASLFEIAERVKTVPHLFQQFIKESSGKDLRAIAVGGKVVAAMQRRSQKDFRSNVALGGTGTAVTPDGEVCAMAQKITAALGLDYCGIDFLYGRDGYLVCEVNSNAFFGGIEKVTKINVARAYAEHVLSNL